MITDQTIQHNEQQQDSMMEASIVAALNKLPKPQAEAVIPEAVVVEETKVETIDPAKVEETKAEETKVEETKVVEAAPVVDWLSGEATPTPTTNPTTTPEPVKSKYDELIESNPELKYVVEAISAGKKLADITNEYKVVDFKNLPDDQLLREYAKLHGIEAIDEDIEALSGLTGLQKLEKRRMWENELNEDQQRKLKTLTATYQKTPDQIAQEEAAQKQHNERFQSALDRKANYIVDKELFNTKFSEADATEYKEFAQSLNLILNPMTEKGEPDYDKVANTVMLMYLGVKKLPAIQSSVNAKAKEQGKSEAVTEISKDLNRPSENSSAVTRIPTTETREKTPEQIARENVARHLKGEF